MKFFIIIFLLAGFVQAKEVLVTTSYSLSREQLLKLVKELPSEAGAEALYEKNLSTPLTTEDQEALFKNIALAEGASLKGNFKLAIKKYEEILKQLEGFANINGLNKITFTSFAKLAELYEVLGDREKSLLFWKKAKAWSPQEELNPEVFTPKSGRIFSQLSFAKRFDFNLNFPHHSAVFINGKKIPSEKTQVSLKFFEGKHQIAVLETSGRWQINNFYASKDSIKKISFKTQPIVTGTCDHPQVNDFELANNTRLIALMENCQRVFDGASWYTLQGQPLVAHEESKIASFATELHLNESSWISDLIKSPWFWGAVGAAGIFVFVKSQEQQTVIVPTHSFR